MSNKYYDVLERFADKYSQTKGVISVEPDDFGVDIIVVLVDDKRYKKIDLPSKFEGYEVSIVNAYSFRDTLENLVNIYIVNDPTTWEAESSIPFKLSFDNIDDKISGYENKINQSIQNSLQRMKDTMSWIVKHNPPPKKTARL